MALPTVGRSHRGRAGGVTSHSVRSALDWVIKQSCYEEAALKLKAVSEEKRKRTQSVCAKALWQIFDRTENKERNVRQEHRTKPENQHGKVEVMCRAWWVQARTLDVTPPAVEALQGVYKGGGIVHFITTRPNML